MALDWMPRDNEPKNHLLHTDAHWGTDADAPCVVYEKRPLTDPKGNVQEGLYVAWIRLNGALEIFEPNVLNPEEQIMIRAQLNPSAGAGTTNMVVVSTHSGIMASTYFSP